MNGQGGEPADGSTGSEFEEVEVEVEVDEDEEDEEEALGTGNEDADDTAAGALASGAEAVTSAQSATAKDSASAPSAPPATGSGSLLQSPAKAEKDDAHGASAASPSAAPAAAAAESSAAGPSETSAAAPAEPSAASPSESRPAAPAEPNALPAEFEAIDTAVKSFVGDIQNKFSALSGLGAEAASGTNSMASMASSFGALFSGTAPAPERNARSSSAQQKVAAASTAERTLRERFGLSADESVVDEVVCKLQQTYACSHNSHTPPIQMLFAGVLSITDKHICFLIQERGKELPVKVAHVFVKRVALKGAGAAATLGVRLKDETSVVFKDFADGEAMTSALALLEHLADGGGDSTA